MASNSIVVHEAVV